MSKKFSELDNTTTLGLNDIFAIAQEDSQSQTGFSSKKIAASSVANKLLNDFEYSSALQTTDKKVIGAINELATAYNAMIPVDEASGSIANFDTEIATPLVNVSCNIVATGGNGTPDNPIPINGYTEANITRCGVNLWDEEWEFGTINNNTGALVPNSSIIRSKNFIPVRGGETILVYATSTSNMWIRVFEYDKNENYIVSEAKYTGTTYQLNANTAYIKFYVKSDYGTAFNKDISILYPSTLTPAYHPYTGNTYTIAFGQTVYGGVLDVTRGKLHVTWGADTIANINWVLASGSSSPSGKSFRSPAMAKPRERYTENNIKCAIFTSNSSWWFNSNIENYGLMIDELGRIYIRDDDYDNDISGFTTALGSTILAYELATPFDIDLTPEVISAVVGTNNVYSDTNGDTTVKFKDSIQHYIDKHIT